MFIVFHKYIRFLFPLSNSNTNNHIFCLITTLLIIGIPFGYKEIGTNCTKHVLYWKDPEPEGKVCPFVPGDYQVNVQGGSYCQPGQQTSLTVTGSTMRVFCTGADGLACKLLWMGIPLWEYSK